MPFGRTGKLNNRSHHSLDVGSAGPGPGAVGGSSAAAAQGPSSASSTNPAAFSKESFDTSSPQQSQQEHQQQPPLAPLHGVSIFASPASGGGGSNPNNPNLVTATGNPQQQQQQQPPPPQQQQQQQPPPPQQQQHSSQQHQVVSPAFDPRSPQQQQQQGKPLDFARSQSTRFPQGTPLQTPLQYAPASTSADDLSTTLHGAPPPALVPGQQPIGAPPPPQQVPEARRSTRKLIKNILSGGGGSSSSTGSRGTDPHHHHHHHSQHQQQQQHYPPSSAYDNTAGLARRPSKRISQPPTIRTGVSQVSLDQQLEWPPQGQQITQPSPLQGVGEFTDPYSSTSPSNRDNLLQDPHNLAHTIRRVPTDHESSPYGPDDIGSPHQGQAYIPLQGQGSPEHQQNPYGQAQYEISPQQYHFQNQQQIQYQAGNPHVLAGHLNTNIQQNPETVSQLSHESPVTDTDQHSAHNPQSTQDSPAVNYPLQAQPQAFPGQPAVSPNQVQSQPQPQQQQQQKLPPPQQPQQQQQQPPPPQQQQQPGMPPPPGPPPGRRSQEPEKMRGQADAPPGPPPGYRHSQASNMNPLPPPPQNQGGGQPPNYRQNAVQDRQFEAAQAEGRNSPQPSASDRDNAQDPDKAMKELVIKYKNVKRLYFDGKNQIDQLTGQVEQLQNAIANQRMSQSRTSLDDNEYTTRFNRLNGAINNLSFNIRKDWVTLPSWIDKYVSADALKTGKQEMTAVGRAVISRWVVEEIFNHCFHPGLDPDLSRQLKEVEQNIRRFSYKMNSQEEFDALTSKVVSWRMATLEGLQGMLNSPESSQHQIDFIQRAVTNLTASLYQHLADPPPPGVDGSASMIVELVVSIAFHLPMESRDVAIIYPLPQDNVIPHLVEVEKTPLPPLEPRPGDESDDEDEEGSGGNDESKGGKDRKSRSGPPPKDPGKVRFAGFMAVDVRGRQVLVKAPVWTLG